jgi:hypothetical protein
VSDFEFTERESWGGMPVVRKVSEIEPRVRLVATGLVVAARTQDVGGSLSGRYTIDDGTGQIDLLFLGQPTIGGLSEGAFVTVEGAVMSDDTRNVIWNPKYRIEPALDY